jgi:hypothetical protein
MVAHVPTALVGFDLVTFGAEANLFWMHPLLRLAGLYGSIDSPGIDEGFDLPLIICPFRSLRLTTLTVSNIKWPLFG